jgi:hypothetical protein
VNRVTGGPQASSNGSTKHAQQVGQPALLTGRQTAQQVPLAHQQLVERRVNGQPAGRRQTDLDATPIARVR